MAINFIPRTVAKMQERFSAENFGTLQHHLNQENTGKMMTSTHKNWVHKIYQLMLVYSEAYMILVRHSQLSIHNMMVPLLSKY